jgi:hypothetical protein
VRICRPNLNQTQLAAFVIYRTNGAMVVASRGDEYRRRAQECLEIAPTFHNDQSRNVLLQMAQVWLRLAENCEADSYEAANKMVGRPKAAEEIRPTVQQQQQIRPK